MRSGLKEDNQSLSVSGTSTGSVEGRRGAEYLGVFWPPGTDRVLGGLMEWEVERSKGRCRGVG